MKNIFKKMIVLSGLILGIVNFASAQSLPVRNVPEYNLQNSLALKGYDPVAIFPEGGGKALMGNSQVSLEFQGVIYFFASRDHLNIFLQNPDKYEPTYGGWCAYAMASGAKVDIQPTVYTIHGNRAHYFVSGRAKQNFDKDVPGYEQRADAAWKNISGEEPR